MSALTLNLDERHDAVLTSLAAEQDMSKTALLRTALRLYQTVHEEGKRGRQLAFQNPDGSFISLVMLGGPMAAESAPPLAGAQQAGVDELLAFVKKIANGEVKDHMFTSLEDEASSLWFRASAQLALARKS